MDLILNRHDAEAPRAGLSAIDVSVIVAELAQMRVLLAKILYKLENLAEGIDPERQSG